MPKIYSVGEKSLRFRVVCVQKGSGRGGYSPEGLPWGLTGKESACKCRRHRIDPWVRKIPWRRKQQPTPVFWLGKSHRGA